MAESPTPTPTTPIKHNEDTCSVQISFGHCSEQGVRPSMEDAVVLKPNFYVKQSKCSSGHMSLFCVFDGHGGSQCAEYLSKKMEEILTKYMENSDNMVEALQKTIEELDHSSMEECEDGSGSTGVILLIDRQTNDLWCANVGDSRSVLIQQHRDVIQLSIEHKPTDPNERKRIEDAEGWVAFGRVMGILAVSRSFGDKDFKTHLKNLVISTPSITHRILQTRDKYIVCACDGLFDVFTNEEVSKFIHIAQQEFPDLSLDSLAKDLVTDAIRNRRSRDNVSTIVLRLSVKPPSTINQSVKKSSSSSSSHDTNAKGSSDEKNPDQMDQKPTTKIDKNHINVYNHESEYESSQTSVLDREISVKSEMSVTPDASTHKTRVTIYTHAREGCIDKIPNGFAVDDIPVTPMTMDITVTPMAIDMTPRMPHYTSISSTTSEETHDREVSVASPTMKPNSDK